MLIGQNCRGSHWGFFPSFISSPSSPILKTFAFYLEARKYRERMLEPLNPSEEQMLRHPPLPFKGLFALGYTYPKCVT